MRTFKNPGVTSIVHYLNFSPIFRTFDKTQILKRPALLLVLAVTALLGVNAQQMILSPNVLASAGGYGESENISLSWTLGELAVTTLTGGNHILTQGFQQSFGLDIGTRDRIMDLNITAYPNPVDNELFVKFGIEKEGDYILEIEDVTGRVMYLQSHRNVEPGDILRVNTSAFSKGVYFLRIMKSDLSKIQVTGIRKL